MPDNPLRVIALMGPTASGKTELAVRLVESLPLEIVSVDSALVYRDMDIGTAKPDADVLARAPHRLIDFLDPAAGYSAGAFRDDALREIADIARAGKTPLLVGGTMLYYRVLQRGLARLPVADPAVRAEILARAERDGWAALHAELARVDPAAAGRIHPNDAQRIERALEVYQLTGRPLSAIQAETQASETALHWIKLGLFPPERDVLHRRIESRFDAMMAAGFLAEVEALHARPDLDDTKPAMRAVGYRQLWAHLDGRCDLATAREAALAATRALARRQLTWLRAETELIRVDSEHPSRYTRALEQAEQALRARPGA